MPENLIFVSWLNSWIMVTEVPRRSKTCNIPFTVECRRSYNVFNELINVMKRSLVLFVQGPVPLSNPDYQQQNVW